MQLLGKTTVKLPCYNGEVSVRLWEKGDPFPTLSKSVGIDTETELITDEVKDPPIVVYGLFDPDSATCWIAYWDEFLELAQYVSRSETRQIYFNVGFDELVIDNEDENATLMDAVEEGRVRDMQIRYHLYLLATRGDIPEHGFSKLADIAKRKLKIELDKGEKDDPNSHRLTFRRLNDDGSKYRMTDKQAVYLAWDCISTWALSQVIPEQPTEVQHTKGMCVLAHISRNGFQVDPVIFDALEKQLLDGMEVSRERLMSFGYPDPEKRNDDTTPQKQLFLSSLKKFCELTNQSDISENPAVTKDRMRFLLTYSLNYAYSVVDDSLSTLVETVHFALDGGLPDKAIKLSKPVKDAWLNEVLEPYDLYAFDSNKSKIVPVAFLGAFLEDMVRQLQDTEEWNSKGFDYKAAMSHAVDYMDDHPWLLEDKKGRVGPKKFFQDHVQKILDKYPALELDTTKSGQIKLAKDDMWRLDDLHIKDDFLVAYADYNHLRKLRSTYVNREYVKKDGRVHPYLKNLVRTGRTAASSPNVQNYPSRDKVWHLKNMFKPYDGMILCATDFSFVELTGFAQACYSRFGFSVMRDIINAGIDPHRWFAAVMEKKITTDLKNKDDPEWVAQLNKHLKEIIDDKARFKAKAANFGLPGGMRPKRFYRHCRSMGIVITMQDAEEMCDAWTNTFKEMKLHMKPEKASYIPKVNEDMFGYREEDPDDLEDDIPIEEDTGRDDAFAYRAVLPCGQVRNRCSYNAACNFMFQGTVAVGAKLAGWELLTHGYGERLCNFVHDEFLYCLYPDELQTHIPIIERLMLKGIRKVIPDVKVGVETTCMLHWDKESAEFTKLKWNDDGTPILEEPPYVQNILQHKE